VNDSSKGKRRIPSGKAEERQASGRKIHMKKYSDRPVEEVFTSAPKDKAASIVEDGEIFFMDRKCGNGDHR